MDNEKTLIETTAQGDAETVLTKNHATMTPPSSSSSPSSPPPPPPTTTPTDSQPSSLIDITIHLDECISSLTYTSPLVATPSFSLLDSMAALELMDPSMDCCEFPPHEQYKLRRPPTSLQSVPWSSLTLPTASDILLANLVALEALLNGSSVAESTYTCVYAHDSLLEAMAGEEEKTVEQWGVFASSMLLVKLSEVIRTIIQHADIYEEEDFVLNAYDFTFGNGVVCTSGVMASGTTSAADGENEILKLSQKALTNLSKSKQRYKNVTNGEYHLSICQTAISFMENFYAACTSLAKMTSVRETSQSSQSLIATAISQMATLRSLLSREDRSSSPYPMNSLTHDPLINRHLLGNAPVRKIKSKPLAESLQSLSTIADEISTRLLSLLLKTSPSLSVIQNHLAGVSTCNILTRSLILLNLYFDDLLLGQHSLIPLISSHMTSRGMPQSLISFSHFGTFLNRLAKPIYDILKLHILNNNRQRGFIEALMLREWGVLQKEASGVDYYYRDEHKLPPTTPSYAMNYTVERTTWIMERYVSLSVELNLWCGPYDFSMVYWYWDFLLSTRLTLVGVMKNDKMRLDQQMQSIGGGGMAMDGTAGGPKNSRKKGKKKNGKKGQDTTTTTTTTATTNEETNGTDMLVMTLKRSLCRGIVRFLAAIYQAKLLQPPTYPFTSHKRRFQKRFEAFGVISQPPPLSFSDFLSGSDFTSVTSSDLISSATDCFKNAKVIVDQLLASSSSSTTNNYNDVGLSKEEIMKYAKVCIGNSLFLHKLRQYVDSGGNKQQGGKGVTVEFDWKVHDLFCSIKVM